LAKAGGCAARPYPSEIPDKQLFTFRQPVGVVVAVITAGKVTRWQAVNWDYSGRLQKAQMDVVELAPDQTFRLWV
jgi:hypothetical protein